MRIRTAYPRTGRGRTMISELASVVMLSPNCSSRQGESVTKFTPHYMGGNCSVETCGEIFAPTSRQASSNYGIGSDGRVACYVDENTRAWTSSSGWNDRKAITVEVANYSEDGAITDAAWESLVALGADVCRRYGFRLEYTGDQYGSLTEHRMFASTDCPGEWLHARMGELARQVNERLDGNGGGSQDTDNNEKTDEEKENELMITEYALVTAPEGRFLWDAHARKLSGIESDAEYESVKGVFTKGEGTSIPEVSFISKGSIARIRAVLARS